MYEKLTEQEIEFMEMFHDPVSLIENLIPENFDAPHMWDEKCKCITIRPYQFSMLSYEYMYADDFSLSSQENFRNKKGAGEIYNISSRNTGKSFLGMDADECLTIIHYTASESCISSFDDFHLDQRTNRVANLIDNHKFYNIYKLKGPAKTVNRGAKFKIQTRNGHIAKGANENVSGSEVGKKYHGLHYKKFYYDEACVDRDTLIRYIDKDFNQHTERISTFINSGRWKENLVYSYNYDTSQIELKPIVDVFKKTKKQYKYYNLYVEGFGNIKKRHLIVSQNQKIMTDKGYKDVVDLKVNDILYTYDYLKLTEIQKQILVGTLLGDAHIDLKKNNHNPNLNFTHSKNQLRYLEYKRNCFKNLFFSFHRQNRTQNIKFQKTSLGGNVGRLTTDTCVDLKEFINFKKYKLDRQIIKNYFSEISLAFWLMDDGQLIGTKGKLNGTKKIILNTCSFSYDDHLFLKTFLKEKYNLNFLIERHKNKYYRLVIKGQDCLNLINLVKNYIYPTMLYKIYSNYELCHFIYNGYDFKFKNLEEKVDYLLQEVKLLEKNIELKKSWTMYDIEVQDNHNFFANGILISNSYMSSEGESKRIDSGHSEGHIERLFGIPDIRVGSPLTKILKNSKKRNWICRVPQYIREDWDEQSKSEKIEKYGGEQSVAYKLNVLAELIEGAYGFWDMARLKKACYRKDRRVKQIEISKDTFHKYRKLLVVEKLPSEQIYICSDIGSSASPSEVIIIFKVGDKYKYHYNISLYNLIQDEQAEIFAYLYEKLGGAFIALDSTNLDGGGIIDRLIKLGIPQNHLLKVRFNENIEVDFERNDDGSVLLDNKYRPVMKKESTIDWAMYCLEDIFYKGQIEIPIQEKFEKEFSGYIVKQIGMKKTYGSSTTDHLHQSFQCFGICKWFNESNILVDEKKKKRKLGVF